MWTRRAFLAAAGLAPASIRAGLHDTVTCNTSFPSLVTRPRGGARPHRAHDHRRSEWRRPVYEPAPRDGRALAKARLIFVNGLGFEGWIDRLIAASKTKALIVTMSKSVRARHGEQGTDPHAWQDVANAQLYVASIRDALIAADPTQAEAYRTDAQATPRNSPRSTRRFLARSGNSLRSADSIVSTHDAFGYFSARYGIEFIAPEGASTEVEAQCARCRPHHRRDQAEQGRRGLPRKHYGATPDAEDRGRDWRESRRHALFRCAFGPEWTSPHIHRHDALQREGIDQYFNAVSSSIRRLASDEAYAGPYDASSCLNAETERLLRVTRCRGR